MSVMVVVGGAGVGGGLNVRTLYSITSDCIVVGCGVIHGRLPHRISVSARNGVDDSRQHVHSLLRFTAILVLPVLSHVL